MCQSFSAAQTDLDFMLNFNEGSGASTFDPTSPTQANIKNANLAVVWVVSSAPMGDNSVYLYPASWPGNTMTLSSCSGDEITLSNFVGTAKWYSPLCGGRKPG